MKPYILDSNIKRIYQNIINNTYFDKNKFSDIPCRRIFPICLGNITDMCITAENRKYLFSLLNEHKLIVPEIPIVIITKSYIPDSFLKAIDELELKVFFFISLSFYSKDSGIEKGISSIDKRLFNFLNISKYKNINAVHYWRPLTSINIPDENTVRCQLKLLTEFNSPVSVITGLKFGNNLKKEFISNKNNPFYDYFNKFSSSSLNDEIFEEQIKNWIFENALYKKYPIYLHTSCAISYLLTQPDYNNTYRKYFYKSKCSKCLCPSSQRYICFNFRDIIVKPTKELLIQISKFLKIAISKVSYCEDREIIFIDTHLTQEMQTFLSQATSFPVRGKYYSKTLEWSGSINNDFEDEDGHFRAY